MALDKNFPNLSGGNKNLTGMNVVNLRSRSGASNFPPFRDPMNSTPNAKATETKKKDIMRNATKSKIRVPTPPVARSGTSAY